MLRDIYIPDLLRCENHTLTQSFKEFFEDLATLGPIEGEVTLHHGGSFLEVIVKAKAIMTLVCDRTLVQFNHKLVVDTKDIVALANPIELPKEQELGLEELTESYPPNGTFPLKFWIYEQLCLAIPFPAIAPDAPPWQSEAPKEQVDHRWDGLKGLILSD